MPEGTTREEAVEAADQVMERAMSVENVEAVGFMMGSGKMCIRDRYSSRQ